jgi:hypothetical protein
MRIILLLLVLLAPALAHAQGMTPLYSSGNVYPSAMANTFGASFNTVGKAPRIHVEPIGISFVTVGLADGEVLDVKTIVITKYGFEEVDNAVTANGETDLTELQIAQLGYEETITSIETSVSSSIANSAAIVELVNHFEQYE